MARRFVSALGLAPMTGPQRDALNESDGAVIYNSDDEEIQARIDGRWESVELTSGTEAVLGVLVDELARHRAALLFADLDPDAFDPIPIG